MAGNGGNRNGNGDDRPMAWRYAGDQMKRWREAAGISRQALADEAGYGYDAIKGMERGVRKAQAHVLRIADEMSGAQGKLAAAVEFLRPEPFPSYSHDFMHAESDAVALCCYETQFVPGLLQTTGYVRALLAAHCPPLDDETIEERIKGRLERQALLSRQTKAFSFVMEEAALHRQVGDIDSWRDQLLRLVETGRPRHVNIQVLPTDRGVHAGLRGPFTLLKTPDHEYLAYEEGQEMGVLYSQPEKVGNFIQRHEMILRQALNPDESARFISRLAEEL